jgi:hypothetical protein
MLAGCLRFLNGQRKRGRKYYGERELPVGLAVFYAYRIFRTKKATEWSDGLIQGMDSAIPYTDGTAQVTDSTILSMDRMEQGTDGTIS